MSQQMLVSLIPIAVILLVVIARVLFVHGGSGGGSIAGMAVCRKCGHAFPRPFIAPNLVTGKLLHCPHCGAWAILPAASTAELELAKSLEQSQRVPPRVDRLRGRGAATPDRKLQIRIAFPLPDAANASKV